MKLIGRLTICFLTACGTAAAQTPSVVSPTYQWSGEFVSLDNGTKTLTVKTKLVGDAVTEVKRFKAGDRVIVTFSGFEDFASGIRAVLPDPQKVNENAPFQLAVELVSTDTPNDYVTIRLRVPDSSVASVMSVKPGEWVTVTSSHRPSAERAATIAVRPYVTASATKTSTSD